MALKAFLYTWLDRIEKVFRKAPTCTATLSTGSTGSKIMWFACTECNRQQKLFYLPSFVFFFFMERPLSFPWALSQMVILNESHGCHGHSKTWQDLSFSLSLEKQWTHFFSVWFHLTFQLLFQKQETHVCRLRFTLWQILQVFSDTSCQS